MYRPRKQNSQFRVQSSEFRVQRLPSPLVREGLGVRGFCILFSVFCLLFSSSAAAFAQSGGEIIINQVQVSERTWPDVTLNLTLLGPNGQAVGAVNAAQFQVKENGQLQEVLGLELGPARSVPIALALVIDVSGSMNAEGKMEQARTAASTFLQSLRPVDRASVIAFNDQVKVVEPFTNDVGKLQAAVGGLQAGGDTAIYDALYEAANQLNPTPDGIQRAIVLLTDGEDTSSKLGDGAAAEIAKRTGALVYTIGLGSEPNEGVLKDTISGPTGGRYYKAPGAADLKAIFEAISVELTSQLFLKYKSSTVSTNQYQSITVEVIYTAPDGQVIRDTARYLPRVVATPTPEPPPPPTNTPAPVSLGINTPEAQPPAAQGSVLPPREQMISLGAAVLAGLSALFGALGIAYIFTPSPTSQRMAAFVGTGQVEVKEDESPSFASRVIAPFMEASGQRIARLSPRSYSDHVEHLLILMGPPYRLRLPGFLGMQLALSVLLGVVFLGWALRSSPFAPAQWLLALGVGVFSGAYLPYFWLKRKVTERQRALMRSLPGALDFLAINVEAGLGFDAALAQVVQRWRNALTDEFALLMIDFQIGKPRKDAWRDLIERTHVPDLTSFVTAMLQNEQVGASIGNLLRTQADQMRIRSRQRAEESARTAPVKMLLPMVFFIFPGIFVVILGPAIPQFLDTFTAFSGR